MISSKHSRRLLSGLSLAVGVSIAFSAIRGSGGLIPTVYTDFQQPGTQDDSGFTDSLLRSGACSGCHGNYDLDVEPYRPWAASMMAQSTRDPIFHAALAIAEQDADFAGALCYRCHSPTASLEGRLDPSQGNPTDGSNLTESNGDFDGVSCNFCHRMVDPNVAPENPAEDAGILAALANPPVAEVHTGQYVIDPEDRRRGPFDLGSFSFHQWRESPFHQESLMCATCHDVSNPVFTRNTMDGSYDKNADGPHPTGDKTEQFPIERTYSEWANSTFAEAEIEMNGRFGGNKTAVSSCQDCHMPDTSGTACLDGLGGQFRTDLPQHHFNGANSWVLHAIHVNNPPGSTGLSDQTVEESIQRNIDMLQSAADLDVYNSGGDLVVRIVNQTGHKLPTGYGEGRRMWINVKYYNAADTLIDERGQYTDATRELSTTDTRVYEIQHGLDADMAAASGIPAGKSFHFVLNNTIELDNRIPPRGFNFNRFEAVQAEPVNATYPNEHYWDDVTYTIPAGAARAEVSLYHQTTTKEYIEFLRDENTTNSTGQDVYNLWDAYHDGVPGTIASSAPTLMATVDHDLTTPACATPVPYGLAKLNSVGTRGQIGSSGAPSAAAGSFQVTVTGARPNTFAQVFWGSAARNFSFVGGSLLVKNPIQRGAIFALDGQGDGSVSIAVTAQMVGLKRYYQVWYRDAQDPFGISLTNALAVDFCD